MTRTLRVLTIEDSEDDSLLVLRALRAGGYEVYARRIETMAELHTALDEAAWDVVLADYHLPCFSVYDALDMLKDRDLDIPFIVVSGAVGEETVVATMKAGAHDYVMKDHLVRLVPAVQRELREAEGRHTRRHFEQALRESEARYRVISELVSDFAYALRIAADGSIELEWITEAVTRITGYSQEATVKLPDTFYTVVHPDDMPLVQQSIRTVLAGQTDVCEFRIVRRDGRICWLYAHAQPVFDTETGQLVRVYGAARDVTANHEAREELRHERDFTSAVLDTAGALVIVLDRTGTIVRFNRACENLAGYRLDDIRSGKVFWQNILPPEEYQPVRKMFNQLLRGNYPNQYEGDWLDKDGQRQRIVWTNTVLLDAEGHVEYIIGTGLNVTERRHAEARMHQQMQRLAVLRRLQMSISASLDLHMTIDLLLDHVMHMLDIDAALVLQPAPYSQHLEYVAGRGFRSSAIQWSRLRMGEGYGGRIALERHPLMVADMRRPGYACQRAALFEKENFVSYYGVPLVAKDQVKGVLELFSRTPMAVDQEWGGFLEALAGHAAVVMDNVELVDHLRRSKEEVTLAYDATIEGWARALELRDAETEGHSRRVTEMTVRLARAMEFDEEEIVAIRRGAILHDIGKMAIPDSILLKPGPLTDEERAIMRQHPKYAHRLLSSIPFLRASIDIPYCHHERWDGTGYPQGLQGEQIPLKARLFSVVDVWDALSSDRPYRRGWPPERVYAFLRENAGTAFDPHVVEVFLKMLDAPGREDAVHA